MCFTLFKCLQKIPARRNYRYILSPHHIMMIHDVFFFTYINVMYIYICTYVSMQHIIEIKLKLIYIESILSLKKTSHHPRLSSSTEKMASPPGLGANFTSHGVLGAKLSLTESCRRKKKKLAVAGGCWLVGWLVVWGV